MFLLKGFKALRILMAMPEKTTSPAVLATELSLASPSPSPGVELGSEDIELGYRGLPTFGWGFGRVYVRIIIIQLHLEPISLVDVTAVGQCASGIADIVVVFTTCQFLIVVK